MYNCKIFTYANGEKQVRFFKVPVKTGKKDEEMEALENEISEHREFTDDDINENLFDTEEEKLQKVDRSLYVSMNRTKNKIYEISRANIWEHFVTLTFNDNVDRFDYAKITQVMSAWLKKVRKANPHLKYLGVPEKHKNGAFHFHFLMTGLPEEQLNFWKKDKNGDDIYNMGYKLNGTMIGYYKHGWSTATKIKDTARVSMYICKYITKEIGQIGKGKKRYWHSTNCDQAIVSYEYLTIEEKQQYYKLFEKHIVKANKVEIDVNGFTNEIKYFELKYTA